MPRSSKQESSRAAAGDRTVGFGPKGARAALQCDRAVDSVRIIRNVAKE
jgi:hypothetical protein